MSKRRLQLIITLTLSVFIVGYWGFYEPAPTKSPKTAEEKIKEIDGFMVNVDSIAFDPQGQPETELKAGRISHYPGADRTLVETPDILMYREANHPIRITALSGEIGPGQKEVFLRQEVDIHEQQADGFQLETTFLRIEPDNDFAETDAPVTLRYKSGETRAIGMKAYLAEDRIQLLDQVRGIHEPR